MSTTTESSVLTGLAELIAMEDLSVTKDGWNDFHAYAYATEAAVFSAARAALARAGLSATISFEGGQHETTTVFDKEGRERPAILATVMGRLTIRDTAGNTVECTAYGMGLDQSDRAIAKAQTAAAKQLVAKALLLPVESDDTDAGHASPVAGSAGQRRAGNGSGGGTASEKQLGFLCSLVKKHHISGEGAVEEMVLRFARMQGDAATEFAKISKQTASDLIERFQKLPDGRGQEALDRMRQWEAENGYPPTPSDDAVPFQGVPAGAPSQDDDVPF